MDWEVLSALVSLSGDPDHYVPGWLRDFVPLGIVEPIPCAGVFPPLTEEESEKAASLYAPVAIFREFTNYVSYSENREAADAELSRERDLGYVRWEPSRERLEEAVGPLEPSRIAVLVKEKAGRVKVRLIHDLSRSGVNHRIRLRERIVLPRLSDVADGAARLLQHLGPEEAVEFVVLDFQDAFKQLRASASEQRYLSGQALDGWFAYLTVLFGVVSGPLVWGRVAALVMRATAAMLDPTATDLHCYVDDPIMALRGTRSERDALLLRITTFWAALGLKLSWKKGLRGSSVEWIGAQIEVPAQGSEVRMSLPESKRLDMIAELKDLLGQGCIPTKVLRRFAGRVTWVAGLLPQLRAFTQPLWAAVSHPASRHGVRLRQVQRAMHWLLAFATGSLGPVGRVVWSSRGGCLATVAFDASPSGGGACLYIGREPVLPFSAAVPWAYVAVRWTSEHERLATARIGDPGSQARWEAFMCMWALLHWWPVIRQAHRGVCLVGDAQGILQAAVRFRGRDPVINEYCMEIALCTAEAGRLLESFHIYSESNAMCDALSRLGEPGVELPARLVGVPRHPLRLPDFRVLGTRARLRVQRRKFLGVSKSN